MKRLLTLVAIVSLATSLQAQNAPLRVIASNGVKTFVEALVPAYEKSSGRKATVTYGTSSVLLKDIAGGAPFDLVIMTQEAISELGKAGKLTGTPTVVGRARVGLGVPHGTRKPKAATAADVKQALLAAKGIAYAGNGASRPTIEAMFATLGVTDTVKGKTFLDVGSDGSIARVNKGDADLLLTLVSEIMPAPGIDLVGPIPAEFGGDVTFAAAVSATAPDSAAARALLASLVSREATVTLHQKGLAK
ncbi:MAG TPA: substrate-binding domain-containing protein [Vicinamibacterales bacterium]|nr:substrate-binding domain-containing protein [Vicinamibacterales bacterium]